MCENKFSVELWLCKLSILSSFSFFCMSGIGFFAYSTVTVVKQCFVLIIETKLKESSATFQN